MDLMLIRHVVATMALGLAACATPINDARISDVRYTPDETTVDDLIAQIGLPTRREAIDVNGQPHDRLIYLRGPQSVTVFHVLAMAPVKGSAVALVTSTAYATDPKIALQCVVNGARRVVACRAGDGA